ncbi:protein disulfide isomerase pTAC5, chloroplastic-like [Trifolium pratense]|uniref:protein disulfide isomerase pTAC5, chloroplastic-like n=1 Tax=Trifolium pratense TaxID=57577 RepID=UPI001E69434E|nr:protein disulfide isomerase pTAC5, chloroplastic-like [Trifolium pratense]XP_045829187.1 protein disulfide isomerase pTAC5, chloroplastic-like [Trifolium pratense]XP_045829197.1 protein disulfide isomerase pTAC5, chloroplastic-like [Trifolium pratense]
MSLSALTVPPITVTTVSINSTLSLTTKTLPFLKPNFPFYKFKSLISHCSISDREEHRWLREEQRWLREEQRWIREENRWNRERDELLREITELKHQIQSLERRIVASDSSSTASVSDAVTNVTTLLQVLKDKNLVLDSGSSQRRLVLEEKDEDGEEEEKETVEVVEEKEIVVVEEPIARVQKRTVLRTGSEGEDVRKLQEALQKLGFYSGEEDMEFSSFSSGTERAVKTWQSSLGVTEDGIMTSELLEKLYLEIRTTDIGNAKETKKSTTVLPKEVENGAAVASAREISEVQQNVVGEVDKGTELSHPRVFLLGENRWEEPSRLIAKGAVDRVKKKDATTKCLQCSGLGILLCTECDGTGEPNIEPQFMEWVGEDTKCPYCEGLGHTICDLCGGKTMV